MNDDVSTQRITVEMTIAQAEAVVDAINCAALAAQGELDSLFDCFVPKDGPDMDAANRMLLDAVERADEVADVIRPEIEGVYKRNPRVQDLLHHVKMMRKYGRLAE